MNLDKRVTCLKDAPIRKMASYVLYWMQTARRAENNEALEFAVNQANALKLPLLVYDELRFDHPYACDRHHYFILESISELKSRLEEKGIRYLFRLERRPSDRIPAVLRLASKSALVISDDFPTTTVRKKSLATAAKLDIPFFLVDANGIVPLSALNKQEYAARTIRPKIQRLLPECMQPVRTVHLDKADRRLKVDMEETVLARQPLEAWVTACAIRHEIPRSTLFKGGYSQARWRLADFISWKLNSYSKARNNPARDGTSGLSPYLHHGVISVREIVEEIQKAKRDKASCEGFLEELIVRRELSYNFTKFNETYEEIGALPQWVQRNLSRHAHDRRAHTYTLRQFELGQTHDPIWNACQFELATSGKIHGYMRMFWGKKIIEWSRTYPEALETMIYLNNQYALDGCNPNSWTGILWCFGLHDRPWGERPVFGTIRYMSGESLKRKVDLDSYIGRVRQSVGE
jgi:deoxyribodipyrimidine photo-lyase